MAKLRSKDLKMNKAEYFGKTNGGWNDSNVPSCGLIVYAKPFPDFCKLKSPGCPIGLLVGALVTSVNEN